MTEDKDKRTEDGPVKDDRPAENAEQATTPKTAAGATAPGVEDAPVTPAASAAATSAAGAAGSVESAASEAKAPEPVKQPEPAKAPEPVKQPEPAKAPEPVKQPEPAKAPEQPVAPTAGAVTGDPATRGAAKSPARAAKAEARAEKAAARAAKAEAQREAAAKKPGRKLKAEAAATLPAASEASVSEASASEGTAPVKNPRAARRIAKAIAAGTAGVASIALLGTVAAGGTVAPRTAGGQLAAVAADVPAGDSLSVCPAAPRLLAGAGDGTDAQFRPESSTATTVLRGLTLSDPTGRMPASGVQSLDGKTLQELTKASPKTDEGVPGLPDLKAAAIPSRTPSGPEVLRVGTLDGKDSTGASALSYRATDGDLRGLAAVTCQAPSSDQWIVGASTLVGRTSVLNLSNPSTTPATVNLELYGDKGQIKAPGSRGLSIGAGQSRSLVLAGLAPQQAALAVHVSSTGGPVTATVQQSVLRGLTPGGVDYLGPTGQPGTRQIIPGVSLRGSAAAAKLGSGFEDAAPTLALAVPGAQDAVVQVRVYGKSGQQALDKGVVNAPAGTVTQIPLSGLPDGDYTIAISSDVSVTAAVRATRGTTAKDPSDFAWVPASAPLSTDQVMTVPVGGTSRLQFGAPAGRAEVSYRAITADGAVQPAAKATLAAGTTATVEVPEKAGGSAVVGYLFSASGDPAYAALVQTEDKGPGVSVLSVPVTGSGLDKLPVRLGH
ncbi:DUF5719 family protein [Arthrobacter sp. Y-9]|uniref:DUF5719 family protein n=1 Tax=Arthrobacter sp. Y-9 TaxID=3039385 RepID=UPI00241E8F58|nr:DUF5719 family protein [Arthrobacter sp. Y-9]WFR84868.1 DUF5719 family protein [Arthrobacter sp. Y-9]